MQEEQQQEIRLCACGNPRYVSDSGKVYYTCIECRRKKRNDWYHANKNKVNERKRPGALALVPAPEPPAAPDVVASISIADDEAPEQAPRASTMPGVLADMLILVDRSREAITRGEIDGLRLAVDVRGVRLHMASESLTRRDDDEGNGGSSNA